MKPERTITIRNATCSILSLALLLTGFTAVRPLDGDLRGEFDLASVITRVRDFAGSADQPERFSADIKKAVVALNVAAGLKTAVKGPRDAKYPILSAGDFTLLVSARPLADQLSEAHHSFEDFVRFQSYRPQPPSPPPRLA